MSVAESVEKSPELDRKDRLALLFREAAERKLGVFLIFEGTGVVGILESIQELSEILDPRHYDVHHFPDSDDDRRSDVRNRPLLYTAWQRLPRHGNLGILDGSYYHRLARAEIAGRLNEELSAKEFKKLRKGLLRDIQAFEQGLADNGYLVLKVRVTRRAKDLKKDLKKDEKKNSVGAVRRDLWRSRVKALKKDYDEFVSVLDGLVEKTQFNPHAVWFTPPPAAPGETATAVCDYLIARLEEHLSMDSRRAVAEFDEAMAALRRLREIQTPEATV